MIPGISNQGNGQKPTDSEVGIENTPLVEVARWLALTKARDDHDGMRIEVGKNWARVERKSPERAAELTALKRRGLKKTWTSVTENRMPLKGKQDIITAMANRIFEDMVSELQFDTILKARQDADKAKRPCRCCGTHCSLPHTPGASASVNSSATHLGIIQTPASQNKTLSSSSGSGTPTKDGPNILLTCPVCKRQFASNRCAAHLATCMGLSTGSRRGARNAKAKMDDRSASPYVDLPDEVLMSASQKAKSKKKDGNGNGKRPPSPSIIDTPTKKLKKQKIGSFSEYADNASVSSSQPPSSLRKSSTASSAANGFASPSPSIYSGQGSPMSTDSAPSTQGQGNTKSNTQKTKVKAIANGQAPAAVAAAAARGPPGSSKGRSIAAARLHGEGDTPKVDT